MNEEFERTIKPFKEFERAIEPFKELQDLRSGEATAELGQLRGHLDALRGQAQERGTTLDVLRGQVAEAVAEVSRLSGALDQARQEATEAERRASAAESRANRTTEALQAAQEARTTAERAAEALRLEVATLTERAAHNADLRAIIAALQAPAPKPQAPAAAVPELTLEPTPKAPARHRGRVQQEKSGNQA
ncbi:hypothetical protein [uncultured Thiodictyon sp.]|uniref:hypothetical protein n=1 Tax=uncultured Thiodictyon sp. TaxID=1846217 RepID=UPI0025CBA9C6|nr:hypothetical protein [uncultured Thiodictyon sp.]